jgi:hypothetical protein
MRLNHRSLNDARQLQPEDEGQCLVERVDLIGAQAAGGVSQAFGVDHRRLLDQRARLCTCDGDDGPEARRERTLRRRGDEERAQAEQFVRLDDDGVARPALLVGARTTRRR